MSIPPTGKNSGISTLALDTNLVWALLPAEKNSCMLTLSLNKNLCMSTLPIEMNSDISTLPLEKNFCMVLRMQGRILACVLCQYTKILA